MQLAQKSTEKILLVIIIRHVIIQVIHQYIFGFLSKTEEVEATIFGLKDFLDLNSRCNYEVEGETLNVKMVLFR